MKIALVRFISMKDLNALRDSHSLDSHSLKTLTLFEGNELHHEFGDHPEENVIKVKITIEEVTN